METGFFSMAIVQTTLSIIISWALFALLCSMIQEMIVQVKGERGRFMRSKIFDKLYDATNQINWGIMLYNHSKIKLLTKSSESPPSELSSKMLAETLIDSISFAHATKILIADHPTYVPVYNNELLNNFEFAVNNLGQSDVIIMLKNYLNKAKINATVGDQFDEEKLYKTLIEDVEIWFTEFGSRTSAWYKKASQKRLFVLGLLISAALNVDSIALFNFYKENPVARTEVEKFYLKNKKELETLNDTYQLQPLELLHKNSVKDTVQDVAKVNNEKKELFKKIDSLKNKLELPIGWDKFNCSTGILAKPISTYKGNEVTFSCLFFKLLGIIISAIAASLGAPFWFDLLKKATTSSILKK